MRRLFQPMDPDPSVRLQYPQWPTLERGLGLFLERAEHFYRTEVRHVAAQHFLVRLLTSIGVPSSLEPQVFFDRVSDVAYRMATGLHMASPVHTGGIHPHGVFYGREVAEVMVAVNEYVDVPTAVANWRQMESVKVYRHPLTDLDLALPNGLLKSQPRGLAVIAINIPLLALQHKLWWEEQLAKPSGSPLTVEHFIAMVVLPSMLRRQLDLSIANRLMARFAGKEIAPPLKSHPFAAPDYSQQVDAVINTYMATVCMRSLSFDQLLASIPQIHSPTFNHLIDIPPSPVTNRIGWVWALAQLPVLEFLVKVNALNKTNRNQHYLREIRLALQEYNSGKSLIHMVPQPYCDEMLATIKNEIVPYL